MGGLTIAESPLEVMARDALRLSGPEDLFPHPDDESGAYGFIGVSHHRDSSKADRAVAEVIYEELHDEFPDEVFWERVGDFGHGWTRGVMVRVLVEVPGPIVEDNFHPAFLRAAELAARDVAVYDSVRSAAEYEATLENISREWPADLLKSDADMVQAVYTWLFDAGIQPGGDDCTWYSADEIRQAGLHLGFWDLEWDDPDEPNWLRVLADDSDEFLRWVKAVARAEQEKTQTVLFEMP